MAITHVTERAPFITVEQARNYLSKKDHLVKTSDTEKLEIMVPTACEMIVERVGEVAPVEIIEDIRFYCGVGIPTIKPIISTATDGIAVASRAGVFTGPESGIVSVEYTAGIETIPQRYINGALELVLHIWRTSQNNNSTGQIVSSDQALFPQTAWALPIRVRELLGLSKDFTNKPFVGRRIES